MMRKIINCFICIFVLTTAYGCAFGTRQVMLNPIKTTLALDASGQNIILEVSDKRNPSLKPVVGHVKNGYGMKTADVVADKEVSIWVRNSIEEELIRLGAHIIKDETKETDLNKITVDIIVCYAQAYWNYGGEVTVELSLRKKNKEVMGKSYSGKATLGTNWAATSKSYQKVLELAMEDMLQKLIPDLIAFIKS